MALLVAVALAVLAHVHAASVPLVRCSMVSSASQSVDGASASQASYTPEGWYDVRLPATVMAGLLQNNVYADPFYNENLRSIPEDPFDVPWWYRCTFETPQAATSFLTFKGINYKANIFLDGAIAGNLSAIVGTFRHFDVAVPPTPSGEHAVAIEVYRPYDRALGPDASSELDLAISFVDWAPYPPDSNMGLWQDVILTSLAGPVSVRHPMVTTTLPSERQAMLSVLCDVENHGSQTVSAVLRATINGLGSFQQQVTVPAHSTIVATFDSKYYPGLVVNDPDLWWPWQMGTPTLHNLTLDLDLSGVISDSITTRFGIRTVSSELDSRGHRLYRVNNRPILIRGAGWSPDLFQRADPARQRAEFDYVRHLNLNAIRLEGKFENDNFFDLADEYGILTMPGWCCCDAWQRWSKWTPEIAAVAYESLRTQVKRLRIHPGVLVFLYGSDQMAPQGIEAEFLKVFQEEHWPNALLSTASALTSPLTGPSGVKMSGPYSWVPPVYWLQDTHRLGGAFGFLTEGGPGEAPLTYESLAATIPADTMWPMGDEWSWHMGNPLGVFRNLRFFTPPLYARYGPANSAAEYLYKAQVSLYEGHRAFFEGYSRNKYTSTGLIQWMLNNAWPENLWHLYDYYLGHGGSYFGTRKACEDVHPIYSYDDGSLWVVNSLYQNYSGLLLSAIARNLTGEIIWAENFTVDALCADCPLQVGQVPKLTSSTTYFLRLTVTGHNVDTINDYWLSTKPDVLDWDNSTFYTTFCSSYADLTALQRLPPVNLTIYGGRQGPGYYIVTIGNPTDVVAFFVHLRAVDDRGEEILPSRWTDNYVTLFPGEARSVYVQFPLDSPDVSRFSYEVYNNVA
eukprot:m.250997 g.250997  ORF g.250997 m.250997 type:complete len:850 (+) comp16986_c0_seq1:23-2572(+)